MKSTLNRLFAFWQSPSPFRSAGLRTALARWLALAPLLGMATLNSAPIHAQSPSDAAEHSPQSQVAPASKAGGLKLAGPLKIVKLLWESNPRNAANTLTRSIATAVARSELEPLREALAGLQTQTRAVLAADDPSDSRYAPSLAAAMLDGSLTEPSPTVQRALLAVESLDQRQMLWQLWLRTDKAASEAYFLSQLTDSPATTTTGEAARDSLAQKVSLPGGAQAAEWTNRMISDALAVRRQWASQTLIEHWSQLSPAASLAAIEPLTANAQSMELLVSAIERGDVPKDLLNTNQLRKWLASDKLELIAQIESIWGRVRVEDDAARQRLVAQTLEQLATGARGSAARGAVVFDRVCSQCHALHGRGFEVGPNIAGNGRGNLQQLVSNILDPSLVIGEAFQAKTVLTVDGEVVAGLVAAENDRYLKLKVQGGKVVEFDKEDIEQVKTSSKSLMPEGVETQMKQQELFDLLAYLCLLKPLDAADNEFIPGTPADFVEP